MPQVFSIFDDLYLEHFWSHKLYVFLMQSFFQICPKSKHLKRLLIVFLSLYTTVFVTLMLKAKKQQFVQRNKMFRRSSGSNPGPLG